jgi:predicted metal-dependent HD superfamily phosphohydrolase
MLEVLTRAYMESHRHYHTMDHIMEMFRTAAHLGKEISNTMYWAIWFHDVVYNIPDTNGINEQESAELCAYYMEEAGFDDESVAMAKKLIMATKTSLQPGVPVMSEEEWLICGLDLYALGAGRVGHDAKVLIWRELDANYSVEEWHQGRGTFLRTMLDKEVIIPVTFFRGLNVYAEALHDRWHRAARASMQEELESLKYA